MGKEVKTCGFSVKVRHRFVVILNSKYALESFHVAGYIFQSKGLYLWFTDFSGTLITVTEVERKVTHVPFGFEKGLCSGLGM